MTCHLGTLAVGETATVTVHVTTGSDATLSNTASVEPMLSDPNPSDDWATVRSVVTSEPSSTTTTTIVIGTTTTTTTTTVPPGCGGRTGFDGIGCLCAAGLPTQTCTGQKVPASVAKQFTKGCTASTTASSLTPGRKTKKLIAKATKAFGRAGHTATQSRAGRKLTAECRAALGTTLGAALTDAKGLQTH